MFNAVSPSLPPKGILNEIHCQYYMLQLHRNVTGTVVVMLLKISAEESVFKNSLSVLYW